MTEWVRQCGRRREAVSWLGSQWPDGPVMMKVETWEVRGWSSSCSRDETTRSNLAANSKGQAHRSGTGTDGVAVAEAVTGVIV